MLRLTMSETLKVSRHASGNESIEIDFHSICGLCGLGSGVDLFGADGGTGSGCGGERDLLDYHDDVPASSWCACSRDPCVVSSQTTQAAGSCLHARIGLVDYIV